MRLPFTTLGAEDTENTAQSTGSCREQSLAGRVVSAMRTRGLSPSSQHVPPDAGAGGHTGQVRVNSEGSPRGDASQAGARATRKLQGRFKSQLRIRSSQANTQPRKSHTQNGRKCGILSPLPAGAGGAAQPRASRKRGLVSTLWLVEGLPGDQTGMVAQFTSGWDNTGTVLKGKTVHQQFCIWPNCPLKMRVDLRHF